jgi:predicted nucleic acid-binding Zn ribbon protein
MTEKRECLDCGEIIKGRADKKFCSDLCRNNYNNKLNQDNTNHVRNVNNILRRNRRIIEELAPEGKNTVPKSKLLEKGFDFTYFTNIHHTKNDTVYHYCYEYGYMPIKGDFYLLVKKTEKSKE